MSTITTKDGTQIYYKDWGTSKPIVFSPWNGNDMDTYANDLAELMDIHGDDDQIVPIAITSTRAAKLIKNATLNIYSGGQHGLSETHKDKLNTDLLVFIES